jgi:hypothetical protein
VTRLWRSRPRLALAGIVLVAAYLRLAHLDLAELRREEAWNLLAAVDLVAGRALPLTGMGTSVAGLENGPALIYLLALPLLFARDAALASAFVALTNVAALVVAALLARRVFGWPAALYGAAAYAVGSWAVYFSRKIWPNDPMPLFSALLALGLYLAVVAGQGRGLVVAGLSLGLLLNLHPSSLALVPFVGLALLLRPAVLRTRAAVLGGAAVVLVSAPFLAHELRGRFPSVRALLGVAGGPARFDPGAFAFAAELVGPGAYPTVVGGALDYFQARALPSTALDLVLAAALALGVATAALRLASALPAFRPTPAPAASPVGAVHGPTGADWRAIALCLLWLAVPLLVSSRRSLPLWNHYFIFLLPALFLFVGVGLARLGRLAATGLLLWAAVVQLWGFEAFAATLRAEGARTIYGVPAAFQRRAADTAVRLAGQRPIVLVSQPGPGAPGGIDDLLPVWRFLIPDERELRFDDGGGMLRLRPAEALYVVAPEADPVAETVLAAGGRPAGPELPLPGSPRGYRFWLAAAEAPAEALGRLENGLALEEVRGLDPSAASDRPAASAPDRCRLAGATWRAETASACPAGLEAGELVLAARWRVGARLPAEELAFFAQLVDDRGRRLAGRDRAGVEAGRLEPGDQVVTWGRMAAPAGLPPGRYWLALGAYRASDTRRLTALDAGGRAAGDLLRVGPLKVGLARSDDRRAGDDLARFDDGLVLEAARLPLLIWRADARPSGDYTVFVHLLDGAGKLVAQDDRPPRDGAYPTSLWEVGERVADEHALAAPPGRYRVVVGMYDPTTGRRLRRVDGGGDAVEIGTVEGKE